MFQVLPHIDHSLLCLKSVKIILKELAFHTTLTSASQPLGEKHAESDAVCSCFWHSKQLTYQYLRIKEIY